ncbi:MAG: PAS domain S-box protein, partial [Candidatus Heimdallarchaeota archaeon]
MDIINILLVDDEEALLEASKLYLENLSEKFQIYPINSAKKALEKLSSTAYDIIISDYQMSEMNGLEFLAELRSVGNETPFIIFTGKGREEVAIQALNLGADYYLQKGGETRSQFRELVNLIEKLVEKKQTDLARKRLLEQQISINKLALTLGDTRDLNRIYKTVFQYIYAIMDADTFVVDFYNKDSKTISHGYTLIEGNVLDIMMFPPIPLGHRESEIQTKVIESGEVVYKSNFYKNTNGSKSNEELAETSSSDGITKSAVYVPMKIGGEIIGVLQVQSYRFDAYSKADIELLSGMANVAAVSIQNARLFGNQYQMTQNLIEEKDRTQKYLNLADALIHALDCDGNVIMINNTGCEILNRSEEEIIGKNWYKNFIPEKDKSRLLTRFQELISGKLGSISTITNPIVRKSGEERIIRWKTDIRRDQQNRIIGILSSGIDITDEIKTQEALKIFQTRYQRLLENVDQGIIIFEKQKLIHINDKTCDIYGHPREKLMNFNLLDLCAPEDRPKVELLMQKERDEGKLIEEASFWVITQSGERKYIQNKVYYAFESGEVVNRFVFVSDKTSELLTSNALEISEENYRSTLDSMGVPIHVADKELRIILANKSLLDWIKSLGIDTNIIGKNVFDIFPFLPQRVKDEYKQVFEEKRIVISKDSTHIETFHIMNETRKIPIIENGKVVRVITIIRDITEQNETEIQLRENEQNTRRLLDNLNDGIILFDYQGNIIDTNKRSSEVLGFSQEELGTMAFNDFISKKDERKISDHYKKIIETGNVSFNIHLKTKGNHQFLSEVNASLIELVGKHHIQVIFRDVSQKMQLEEEKEKRINDLMFLSQTAVNFVSLPIDENIFEYIGLKIREIVGESIVVTFSYDSESKMFLAQTLIGLRKNVIKKIIATDPTKIVIPATKDVLDLLMKSPIEKFDMALSKLSNGLISKSQEKLIRSIFKMDDIYSVSFTHSGKLFGLVMIAPTVKGIKNLPNRELLSAFANQTAVALLRRKAEIDLHDSEEKYRILFSDSNDGIIIFNSLMEIIDFNQKADDLLGFKKTDLREKKIIDLLPQRSIKGFLERISNLQDNKIAKFEMDLSNQLDRTFTVEITANFIEVGQKQQNQIIFRNITQKKIVEEIRKKHIDTLRFISKSAMEFVGLPSEKDIYHFIGEKVSELAGDSITIISLYDEESN